MKHTALASLIFCLSSTAVLADATVTVMQGPGVAPLTITGAKRLADVVSQPALARTWWPGAVISERQATAVAEQQHKQLLNTLRQVAAEEGGDDGAAINSLRTQLEAIKVTGRQIVNLDPDRVRVRQQDNVPVEGQYQLWAGAQPSTVTLFGLINKPGRVTFSAGRSVVDYLDDVSLLSGAERSYAWIIYPDGRTEKTPVAYWNRRHVEPMPGSIIFVGFADSLFSSTWEDLNAQILRSLTHRIPD